MTLEERVAYLETFHPPMPSNVYEITAVTAAWVASGTPGTADQTVSIRDQIAAVPDGTPGNPNIIRFPVGLLAGKYYTEGDLANNLRGVDGVFTLVDRHHLIIEGPSAADPATFYTTVPAVPYEAQVNLNEHSLRRHWWFQDCTNITVRNMAVEGSNWTFSDKLGTVGPSFWHGGNDNGGTSVTRGYHASWEVEHGFAFHGCSDIEINDVRVSDVWGDGIYLGNQSTCQNVTIRRPLLVGTGRQGLAISHALNVVVEDPQIGTTTVRPRRAAFDLEPSSDWVVQQVEIFGFNIWHANARPFASLGSGDASFVHIHDGTIHTGASRPIEVRAPSGSRRTDWTYERVDDQSGFGSPQAAYLFERVDNVIVRDSNVGIVATQSRRCADFNNCQNTLMEGNNFGEGLWVDYDALSSVPQLADNVYGNGNDPAHDPLRNQ